MDGHKPKTGQISSPEDIQQLATAFQKSRVLLSAFELDVFTALSERSRTSIEVAEQLNSSVRGTDRLLNTLCALGFLRKEKGRFSNSDAAERFLVKGKEAYMSGLMHISNLWRTWSTLTQKVKEGEKAGAEPITEKSMEWFRSFIAAMHQRSMKTAPEVVARLDLSNVSRVLDIGGGSGGYSIGFVRANQGITCTVFDLPNVIPLTKEYVAKAGLSDRFEFVEGDYHKDDLGQGFDLVFLSAIIHINSPEENQALISKSHKALNPGGQIVVQDFIMEEERTMPLLGALFALNMVVGTESGDTYTESEIRAWMEKAGFEGIRHLEGIGPTSMIIGRSLVEG